MPLHQPRTNEFVYLDNGLLLPKVIDLDRWIAEVANLQKTRKALLFWLGDAFNGGADRFGELHAQAIEILEEESIMNAMRVCRAIPIERRVALGFSFHQAVYRKRNPDGSPGAPKFIARPIEQQDAFLQKALTEGWTRDALRDALKEFDKATVEAARREQQQQPVVLIGPSRLPGSIPETESPVSAPADPPPRDGAPEPDSRQESAVKFDAVAFWRDLSSTEQQLAGVAGIIFAYASRRDGGDDLIGFEAAAVEAQRVLDQIVLDVATEQSLPDLSPLGVQACRVCGCTNEIACPEGCSWVEDDLCSSCQGGLTAAVAEA